MKKGIRWLIKMFYNTGNEKVTEKIFLRAMISSVLGIILCTVCLAGMTWAWFSDSVTSHSSNITSASFSVKVTVNKGTGNTEIPLTDGKYILEQRSEKYKVTLEATGTASTVYCKVNINEVIYTVQLNPNSTLLYLKSIAQVRRQLSHLLRLGATAVPVKIPIHGHRIIP